MFRLQLLLLVVFAAVVVVGNTLGTVQEKHRVWVSESPTISLDSQQLPD